MLIHIQKVLDAEQLAMFRRELEAAEWTDGRGTAGYLAQQVKRNMQLPEDHPTGKKLGDIILRAVTANAQFTAAALPRRILPPMFNSYGQEQRYGRHIDGAIRQVTGTGHRIRTDLSATLFISEPGEYDGGELVIDDTFGPRAVKLKAGDLVLYPGTSVHQVNPVTRGRRVASFFWIQSIVREDHKRTMLLELDRSIQRLAVDHPGQPVLTDLAGVYHNLLRLWADT